MTTPIDVLARNWDEWVKWNRWRGGYRAMATSLGYERHMKWAEAMP